MVVEVSDQARPASDPALDSPFILSDIDGTLVPHPYFSGLTTAERAVYVKRMARCFDSPRFGLITGRGRASYDRLLADSGVALAHPAHPALLGLEFGAHLQARETILHESSAYAPLHAILDSIDEAVGTAALQRPEYASEGDLLSRMAQGRIQGFVLEPKALIGQVEWYFSEASTQAAFGHFVTNLINPLLIEHADVAVQVFSSRVDLLARGFVPKADLRERAGADAFDAATGGARSIIALGDELYDAYMFRYLRSLQGSVFSSVRCYSVGRDLPHADGRFDTILEALTQVESWLG